VTSEPNSTAGRVPELLRRLGLDATYQHISLLDLKREQLEGIQIAAEEQFLHQLGVSYSEGRLNEVELALVYRAYVRLAVPGFSKRWESSISSHPARLQYIARSVERSKPNMPDGTWRGSSPLAADDHMPPRGRCVVYVLYDAANEPCYVGSTQNLAVRLQSHRSDGKEFVRWTASACADREAAYQLEERLLSEFKPYLNKKRSR
jgi:hypothetical protein